MAVLALSRWLRLIVETIWIPSTAVQSSIVKQAID